MLLQLHAGILWHSLGSTDLICPVQGLSPRLAVRREFPDKELGALLELPDLPKSNCARLVLPGLLNHTSLENSFWGALPPMVGQSFLWTGSSPEADGPASAAIWANCQVGNDDGDLPTSSSHLASSTCLSASSTSSPPPLWVRAFWWGWVVHWRGRPPSLLS